MSDGGSSHGRLDGESVSSVIVGVSVLASHQLLVRLGGVLGAEQSVLEPQIVCAAAPLGNSLILLGDKLSAHCQLVLVKLVHAALQTPLIAAQRGGSRDQCL